MKVAVDVGGLGAKYLLGNGADTTPPAAPTGLAAMGGNGQVTLDWADNTETDLAGYRVYRGTSSSVSTSGAPLNGALLISSSYTDTTVTNGATYYYVVTAVDTGANTSSASAAASATPQPAPAVNVKVNFQTVSPRFLKLLPVPRCPAATWLITDSLMVSARTRTKEVVPTHTAG